MNIANALPIEGWMEPHDLEWLAEQAAKRQRIAEVGCWHGRSTMCLADNTQGIVYAVDHWKGSVEHQPVDPDHLYNKFLSTLAKHILEIKVIPVRLDSVTAAAELAAAGLRFDMVFIDASHDYESVCADIRAWKPLVRSGGILCGHDAGHPPVMKATHELLPGVRHEHSMWVVDIP